MTAINWLIYKVLFRSYWRLNAIIGYVLIVLLALFSTLFKKNFIVEYKSMMPTIKNSWYKY